MPGEVEDGGGGGGGGGGAEADGVGKGGRRSEAEDTKMFVQGKPQRELGLP